jgi:hypothetical protein
MGRHMCTIVDDPPRKVVGRMPRRGAASIYFESPARTLVLYALWIPMRAAARC